MIYEFKRWRVEVDYYYHDEHDGLMLQIGSHWDVPTLDPLGGVVRNERIGFKVPAPEDRPSWELSEACAKIDRKTQHIPATPAYLPSFLYDLGKELSRG